VVGALDLARRGGRLAREVKGGAGDADGIPVLALSGGQMQAVGRVNDQVGAVQTMTAYVVDRAAGRAVRVGVGDALSPDLASAFAAELGGRIEVVELVHYEIGPSVGAHTGIGTVGACFFTDRRA
jgi:fatty acid-binding protein DegV